MTKDERLDSNVTIQGESLKSVVGESLDEIDILGYAVMYTAGADWNVLVPRDWLLNRCEELNINDMVIPSSPRPSSAYKRAVKRLKEDGLSTEWATIPRRDNGVPESHRVEMSVRDGDSTNVRHLYADIFYDSDESGEEGGEWVSNHLGFTDYDAETQDMHAFIDSDVDSGSVEALLWSKYTTLLREFFNEMKETHIGLDIRMMMYQTTRDYTRSVVSLRDGGGVYFFPSGLTEFVDSMAVLYSDINRLFKTRGGTMAVRTLPVLDSKQEREWIEECVRKELNEAVDNLIDEAFEEYSEGTDVSEIVRMVREELHGQGETAEMYNALLEIELSLPELMEERKGSLNDEEKEELIDRVLAQQTIS